MILRFSVLLALLVSISVIAPASPAVLLIDASRSMALPGAHGTRRTSLLPALRRWLDGRPENAPLTVLAVNRSDSLFIVSDDPEGRDVAPMVAALELWGTVDLQRSIERAVDIGADRYPDAFTLMVLTDGEDHRMLLGESASAPAARVSIEALLPEEASIASVPFRTWLASIPAATTSAGGDASPSPHSVDEPSDLREDRLERRGTLRVLLERWARAGRWVFLLATGLAAFAFIRAQARYHDRRRRVERHNSAPPTLTLACRVTGQTREISLTAYPTVLHPGLFPDLVPENFSLRLSETAGRFAIDSDEPFVFNGLRRSHADVGEGDQIRIGSARIVFVRIDHPRRVRPPRAVHARYAIPAVVAACLSTAAFLVPLDDPRGDAGPPAPLLPAAEASSESLAATRVSDAIPSMRVELEPLSRPVMVSPGQVPGPERYDFVAIHAHPDDEALDFGGLAAALALRGIRGAYIVLTDGESGLDQYPHRPVDDLYPPVRLYGRALAERRERELAEGVGWLGFHTVVRLGLSNRPYGSLLDSQPADEVVRRWDADLGDAGSTASILADLLGSFQPTVVLSPDVPSAAREHFEHEAAGLVVRRALEMLDAGGRAGVRLHLLAIDPLQTRAYDRTVRFDPWAPIDGVSPRLYQLAALAAHHTQYDSTVDGIETRMGLPYEFWRIAYDREAGVESDILQMIQRAVDRDHPSD